MPACSQCRTIHVQLFAGELAVASCRQGAGEYWKSVELIASRSALQTVLVGAWGTENLARSPQGVRVQSTAWEPAGTAL